MRQTRWQFQYIHPYCRPYHTQGFPVSKWKKSSILCNAYNCLQFNVNNMSSIYAAEVKNWFDLLSLEGKDPDEQWLEIRDTIVEIAEKYASYQKHKMTNRWLTVNTINIANQRKVAKARSNRTRLKIWVQSSNAKLGKTRTDSWMNNVGRVTLEPCLLQWRCNPVVLPQKGTLRDCDGNELSGQSKIKNSWREYKKELYYSSSIDQVY